MAAALIAACYGIVLVSMYISDALDFILLPVAVCNLIGSPLLSLGYLGEDGIEVSEVGCRLCVP